MTQSDRAVQNVSLLQIENALTSLLMHPKKLSSEFEACSLRLGREVHCITLSRISFSAQGKNILSMKINVALNIDLMSPNDVKVIFNQELYPRPVCFLFHC